MKTPIASLQRFVEFKVGPFLASGGSGEANSLSWDEVRRVYQIGVEVCRGKVPVYANMPEVRSAQEAINYSRLAIEAGVDIVNLYGPASMRMRSSRIDGGERTRHLDERGHGHRAPGDQRLIVEEGSTACRWPTSHHCTFKSVNINVFMAKCSTLIHQATLPT